MSVEEDIAKALEFAVTPEPFPPSDRGLADLPRNDIGNAKRIIARHGHDLVFVDEAGWHHWDGKRWFPPPAKRTPEAQKRAHLTVEAINQEADELQVDLEADLAGRRLNPDDKRHGEIIARRKEQITAHYRFAVSSGNSGRVSAMLSEAEPYLRRSPAVFDKNPYLVNVANGTLMLGVLANDGTVPVRLRPHDRLDLIRHLIDVTYDPEATAPKFRTFLAQILPDPVIQRFVQVWFGYCLTGDVSEQQLVLFIGKGANGKSTLLKVIAETFGNYAITLPIQTFLADERRGAGDATPDLARLPGARLVLASEPERGSRLSEAVVKTVTGGEKVVARKLFEGQFEFDPCFKLVLSANEKPRITGQDEGIWRRVLLVPFEVSFPKERRNRHLAEELLKESSGILNWLLDGYRTWREHGLGIPPAVEAATQQYRSESDPIGEYLRVCTKSVGQAELRAKDLYDVYCAWCRRNAQDPTSNNAFGRRLSDLGIHKETAHFVYYALQFTEEGNRLLEDLRRRPSKDAPDDAAATAPSGEVEQ